MRPLRLRLRGLRSYREDTALDLAGLGLFALVGDTGAGKSSLLEAICFALYGSSTWDRRSPRDLVSTGAPAMEVELDFRAGEHEWRVTRVFHTGSRPTVHRLVRLDDDDAEAIDGEERVNARIAALTGLSYDQFLRTVILPQGRFDQLLKARPSDRTDVLKGIFRLERLEAVRDEAARLREEVEDRLRPLLDARARLPADPAAELALAGAREAAARGALERVDAAAGAHAAAAEAQRDAARAAAAMREAAEPLRAGPGAAVEVLAGCAALEAELTAGDAADREADAARAAQVADLDGRLAARDAQGLGASGLATARALLARLGDDAPALHRDRAALAARRDALAQAEAAHEAGAGAVRHHEGALQAAEAAEGRAAAALRAAEAAAAAQAEHRRRDAEREDARRAVAAAGADHASALAACEQARARWRAADAARAAAERHEAAAHAAEGHVPGDPCPVCLRELPAGFVPPAAAGIAAAREAAEAAQAARRAAEGEVARLAGRAEHARGALDEADARLERAARALAEALAEARAAVAHLDADRDDAPAHAIEGAARDAHARAGAAVRAARDALAALRDGRAAEAARLAGERQGMAERAADLDARARRVEQDRLDLPGALRPTDASPAALAACGAALDAEQDQVSALTGARVAAEADRRAIVDRRTARATRREREVEVPRRQARDALDALARALDRGLALLGDAPAGDAPAAGEPARARALADAAGRAGDRLAAAAERREADARAAGERAADALRAAGCADADALHAARDAAVAALGVAAEARSRAERAVPEAAALDARTGPGTELARDLQGLERALSRGAFLGYAVAARQRALLGIASEILLDMTQGRYGFAEGFEILDVPAGVPRSVKTLSGGETFLASLALALALVELAGRQGGRIEALFLDEGFGSLDADALEEALGELERRAGEGRLVGVISHVQAVAERIDDVLVVRADPDRGSVVDHVAGTERERMLEDAAAGLLA